MFNSKKIKNIIQKQDLLDAKINSLAHGQKTLSEDFEVHFKRLRQSIYSIAEELSQLSKDNFHELSKQLKEKESESLEITKKQEERWVRLEETSKLIYSKAKEELALMPTQDKMKYQVQNLEEQKPFDFWSQENQIKIAEKEQKKRERERLKRIEEGASPWDELLGFEPTPLSEQKKKRMPTEKKPRGRTIRIPVEERKNFSIGVHLPEGVLNYLLNRSKSNSVSLACRNVFERDSKLVFAPLSTEITKNFVSKKRKSVTICVSKNTYLAMQKISSELETTIAFVANNFIASMDFSENARVSAQYEKLSRKETQITPPVSNNTKGRPSKK
jgi:hypothetical protein